MENLGQRIIEERTATKLNQDDFAEKCGTSKRTQHNYEKGKRNPDAAYLAKAAKLGCDVQYIITGIRSINTNLVSSPQLSIVEKPCSLSIDEAVDLVGLAVHEGLHTTYQVRRIQNRLFDSKLDALGSKDLITKAAKMFAHCHLTGDSPAVAFEKVISEALSEDNKSSA